MGSLLRTSAGKRAPEIAQGEGGGNRVGEAETNLLGHSPAAIHGLAVTTLLGFG
jgi:hypothetical protein